MRLLLFPDCHTVRTLLVPSLITMIYCHTQAQKQQSRHRKLVLRILLLLWLPDHVVQNFGIGLWEEFRKVGLQRPWNVISGAQCVLLVGARESRVLPNKQREMGHQGRIRREQWLTEIRPEVINGSLCKQLVYILLIWWDFVIAL